MKQINILRSDEYHIHQTLEFHQWGWL